MGGWFGAGARCSHVQAATEHARRERRPLFCRRTLLALVASALIFVPGPAPARRGFTPEYSYIGTFTLGPLIPNCEEVRYRPSLCSKPFRFRIEGPLTSIEGVTELSPVLPQEYNALIGKRSPNPEYLPQCDEAAVRETVQTIIGWMNELGEGEFAAFLEPEAVQVCSSAPSPKKEADGVWRSSYRHEARFMIVGAERVLGRIVCSRLTLVPIPHCKVDAYDPTGRFKLELSPIPAFAIMDAVQRAPDVIADPSRDQTLYPYDFSYLRDLRFGEAARDEIETFPVR